MIDFGAALRRFREDRGVSLRELSSITQVDHVYIHRLEIGTKSNPTEEMIDKLARGLKLSSHRRRVLTFLVTGPALDEHLFEIALEKPEKLEAVKVTATIRFRGGKPRSRAEWESKVEAIDRVIGEDPE